MRRGKTLVAALAIGASVGALSMFASPANAAACSGGGLCLYDQANFRGEQLGISGGSGCVNLGPLGWADRPASATNSTGRSAAGFQNPDCSGDPIEIRTSGEPNLPPSIESVWVG